MDPHFVSFFKEPTTTLDPTTTFIIVGAGALAVVILAIVIKKYSPKGAETTEAITLALTLYDVVLDILFILSLASKASNDNSYGGVFVSMIVFTLLPVVVNIVLTIAVAKSLFFEKPFMTWYKENQTPFVVFVVLAGTNIDVLAVLSSRILGLGFFSAPWSKATTSRLSVYGLAGVLLEDVAQLIMQASSCVLWVRACVYVSIHS